ncbi:MAG: hypothetical protein COA57_06650 [Flavobacteriales bacterium]|nr:MAG: hypothetical protein COA57_06650 [Flavobacteriales bacterium]
MFRGTDDFKNSLKESFNVHERPIWMPAAGGSFEMWFEIFVNTSLIDFLKGAFIGGAAYDIVKHAVFKPFVDSLGELEKANEYPLEIQKYAFFFEDTKIIIYGLATNFTSIFSAIFSELYNTYDLLSSSSGTSNIHEIRIPVDPESGRNEWWIGPEEIGPYLTYWGISIDFGVDYFIWDVQNKQMISNQ